MDALSRRFMLLLLILLWGVQPAWAGLILQNNWRYTTADTSRSSDASATYQPLNFSNLLNSTSATGAGNARASEDLFGGNSARVNLVYTFDFVLDTPMVVGLSDRLFGSLFLGDTDSARVDTFVQIINQATNGIVASLPSRSHIKSGVTGTDVFDESAPFFQHLFYLTPGDYLLQSGLDLSANATAGVGNDRMESAFSYTAGMTWSVPEPSSLSLLIFGGLGLLLSTRSRQKLRA